MWISDCLFRNICQLLCLVYIWGCKGLAPSLMTVGWPLSGEVVTQSPCSLQCRTPPNRVMRSGRCIVLSVSVSASFWNIQRAINDGASESLLTVIWAFAAKFVVLPASFFVDEQWPLQLLFLAQSRHLAYLPSCVLIWCRFNGLFALWELIYHWVRSFYSFWNLLINAEKGAEYQHLYIDDIKLFVVNFCYYQPEDECRKPLIAVTSISAAVQFLSSAGINIFSQAYCVHSYFFSVKRSQELRFWEFWTEDTYIIAGLPCPRFSLRISPARSSSATTRQAFPVWQFRTRHTSLMEKKMNSSPFSSCQPFIADSLERSSISA